MRTETTSITLCAAIVAGCAVHDPGNSVPVQPPLPIVSGLAPPAMIVPRFENFPNSWTPSEAEVMVADPQVQACVTSHLERLRTKLSQFVRHYSGWTVDGRRTLRVQFFDTRHFPAEQLRHSGEVVDGDDDTYFVVTFDVESGTCSF